jgi:hypothetical protein
VIKKTITDQALTHSALTLPVQSFILNHLSVRYYKIGQKSTKDDKRGQEHTNEHKNKKEEIKKKKKETKG